jgi:hypothetical protein
MPASWWPEWTAAAACLGKADGAVDPWHTESRYDEARQVCGSCPVRDRCLEWAVGELAPARLVEGVWAGLTPAEVYEAAGLPRRGPAPHGTHARYAAGPCLPDGHRCTICMTAHATYEHHRRQRLRFRPPEVPPLVLLRPHGRGRLIALPGQYLFAFDEKVAS